jgi:hypothetical protein
MDPGFPRLTIGTAIASALIAIASVLIAAYALNYTISSQTFPPVDSLAGNAWHCFGKCSSGEIDSISVLEKGAPKLLLSNGKPASLPSNAVYDVSTGVIECLGSLEAGLSPDGCALQGHVSHNGKLIVWKKAGSQENNLTAWSRP